MPTEDKKLISEQLARFVVWTKFEDIPEELVIKAQRHILDSVGAGIAGAVSPETRLLGKVFSLCGENGGDVPLWGKGVKASARNAALSNGGLGICPVLLRQGNQLGLHPHHGGVRTEEDGYDL